MKPEAKTPPSSLSAPKPIARHFTCILTLLSVLAAVSLTPAHAADQDALSVVKKLSTEKLNAGEYAAQVAKLVKQFPKDAEAIIAEAVKDEPGYACDVVKAGILALTPNGGTPDPKVVASIVASVVQNIQATHPELMEQIISCAMDVAKDAGPDILNAIAGLYNGPNSINKANSTNGGPVAPGVGGNPALQPPPTPPPQVTTVQPM
jgi:hypothetical protein